MKSVGTVGPGFAALATLGAVLAFLYVPVLVLVVYSFNASRFALAWDGFTLGWYAELFRDPDIGRAVVNTLLVSTLSTIVSVALGTGLAVALHFGRLRESRLAEAGVALPILVPDVIQGVGLLAFFSLVAFPLGLASIVLAHVSFQTSFVAILVRARLDAFPITLVQAARDLGAGPARTLAAVVLPLAAPGIAAGALVAFTLSVDDFLIAYFTAGPGASTLPIRIYSMIRRGVTPEVNALATLLLVFSLVTITAAVLLLRRGSEPAADERPSATRPDATRPDSTRAATT